MALRSLSNQTPGVWPKCSRLDVGHPRCIINDLLVDSVVNMGAFLSALVGAVLGVVVAVVGAFLSCQCSARWKTCAVMSHQACTLDRSEGAHVQEA